MTRTLLLAVGAVALSAGAALAQSTPDYTGSLNSMPPGAARPAEAPPSQPVAAPATTPAPVQAPVNTPPAAAQVPTRTT
ncbi:MAG: hypothetical protein K2X07_13190, partial [Caulobacteraceae bacterium]|nr:hypothetical protein [Caulobacteraceae bacterium]